MKQRLIHTADTLANASFTHASWAIVYALQRIPMDVVFGADLAPPADEELLSD